MSFYVYETESPKSHEQLSKEIRHLQGVIDIALRNLEKGRVYQATNILRKANEGERI